MLISSSSRHCSGVGILDLPILPVSFLLLVSSFPVQDGALPLADGYTYTSPRQPVWGGKPSFARLTSKVRSSTRLAGFLATNLELLANERSDELPVYESLQWIDPSHETAQEVGGSEGGSLTSSIEANDKNVEMNSDDSYSMQLQGDILPLYPLPAVYLPSLPNNNHTLINTEPRNVRMAQDLLGEGLDASSGHGGRFCVALKALDTGRLATVGTVLRIVNAEPQGVKENGDPPDRIVLTCVSEGLVDIVQIINPSAASWESRVRRSSEYLRARVMQKQSSLSTSTKTENSPEAIRGILDTLVKEYNQVRDSYIASVASKNPIVTEDLPPFSRDKLEEALPRLSIKSAGQSPVNDITINESMETFWALAQVWQSLCYTIREGREIKLAADRNELLVASIIQEGKPLKLPIHVDDLSDPANRQKIQELEWSAQRQWIHTGLDPCLDFQVLLALDDNVKRLRHLTHMIVSERHRLDSLAQKITSESFAMVGGATNETNAVQPRKGAWFEDDW